MGQILQKDDNSIAGYAIQSNPLSQINRRIGRSRATWHKTVKQQCNFLEQSYTELKYIPSNRIRSSVVESILESISTIQNYHGRRRCQRPHLVSTTKTEASIKRKCNSSYVFSPFHPILWIICSTPHRLCSSQ